MKSVKYNHIGSTLSHLRKETLPSAPQVKQVDPDFVKANKIKLNTLKHVPEETKSTIKTAIKKV